MSSGVTIQKDEKVKWGFSVTSLAMPQDSPKSQFPKSDYTFKRIHPISKDFGGINNTILGSLYDIDLETIVERLKRMNGIKSK